MNVICNTCGTTLERDLKDNDVPPCDAIHDPILGLPCGSGTFRKPDV